MALTRLQHLAQPSGLGEGSKTTKPNETPSQKGKTLDDPSSRSPAHGETLAKLELLPVETQRNIFKYHFLKFSIQLKSIPSGDETQPAPKPWLLAWWPSPAPISLALTSRAISSVAVPVMQHYTTRSLYQHTQSFRSHCLLLLLDVDLLYHLPLTERIEFLHLDQILALELVCARKLAEEQEILKKKLKTVEIYHNIGKPPMEWSDRADRREQEIVRDIITDLAATDISFDTDHTATEPGAPVAEWARLAALARNMFDSGPRYDHVKDALWLRSRWFDININLTAFSQAAGVKLEFTAVLPYEKCQGTCLAKTLKGRQLEEWKHARDTIMHDCNCIIVEKLRLVRVVSTRTMG